MARRAILSRIFISLLFLLSWLPTFLAAEIQLTEDEAAWIKAHPVITVGHTLKFPPLLIQTKPGEFAGVVPDLFERVAQRLGIEFKYVADDWDSLLDRVQRRDIDLVGAMNRSTAENYGLETVDTPINFPTMVFARKDRTFPLSSSLEMHGLNVAYHRDKKHIQRYLEKHQRGGSLLGYESTDAAFNAVLSGKADIVVGMNIDSYLLVQNSMVEIEPVLPLEELWTQSVVGLRSDYPIFKRILAKAFTEVTYQEKSKILSKWSWMERSDLHPLALTDDELEYLKNHPVLRVQNLSNFPPFNFYEEGRAKGYTVDYINMLGDLLGVEIEFISNKPWHEYLQMLKEGDLDIIPHIAATEERKAFIDFTPFSHIDYVVGAAVNERSDIETLSDLEGKVVAVTNKNFLHNYLMEHYPNLTLLVASTTNEALKAVALGRADVVLASLPQLDYYIHKNWFSNVRIRKIDRLELPERTQLPMGVAKGNSLLLSILIKANEAVSYSRNLELKDRWIDTHNGSYDKTLTPDDRRYLAEKKSLRTCLDPQWLPLEAIEDGQHTGITSEYIRRFEAYLGVPIKPIPVSSWEESVSLGKAGKCDFFPLVMPSADRETFLSFTSPYISLPLVYATTVNETFVSDIKRLDHRKVGVVRGYAISERIKSRYPKINLIEVDSIQEGLSRVSSGELYAYIDALSSIGYWIQNEYTGELKVSGTFDDSWDLSIGVSREEPQLKPLLEKALGLISAEERKRFHNSWVSINYQRGTDYQLIIQIITLFIIIALVLIYRNRAVSKLNQEIADAHKQIVSQQAMVDRHVLITHFDQSGKITAANPSVCRVFGYVEEDLIGGNLSELFCPEEPTSFYTDMWAAINTRHLWSGEVKCVTSEGRDLYLLTHVEPVISGEKITGYRAISEDVTDKKRIEELSVRDGLTGLFNRLKIDEILSIQQERFNRQGLPFTVILLDIDDFKNVNDRYGHDVGDCVLQHLAVILSGAVRKIDVVGRWGGEEFVVICENTDLTHAYVVAEKIRLRAQQACFEGVESITVSIGVSQYQQGDKLSALFKRADQALYVAKRNGKNRVEMMPRNMKKGGAEPPKPE